MELSTIFEHLDLYFYSGPVSQELKFAATVTYTTQSDCVLTASADFNGDNVMDIATANYEISTVDIFLGHGDGSLYKLDFDSVPENVIYIAVKDLNDDRNADIITIHDNDGTL
jgi:hypothetical protein